MSRLAQPGVPAALGAALLFGAGTPVAKTFLQSVDPWLMAGLLYFGSGVGLLVYRLARSLPRAHLEPGEWPWLAGSVISGGCIAPVLLMYGLSGMPASAASLLLNAEGVFTALLAWYVFRENFDRRIALGMAAIVAGAVVLSWPGEMRFGALWPTLAVLGACLAWGIDNNLTRRVSLGDATWIAAVKGLGAGIVNLIIAMALGSQFPAVGVLAGALLIGVLSYGVSLTLFVLALRNLGTARTGAYFSVAPFFGAAIAIVFLDESASLQLLVAGALMALGVWLHLTERHGHEHVHERMEHEHEHEHDEHHRHEHDPPVAPGTRHTHRHRHEALSHAHPHYPDAHHRHDH
jgi:drug/metabolite transporter (DMT)-like permease